MILLLAAHWYRTAAAAPAARCRPPHTAHLVPHGSASGSLTGPPSLRPGRRRLWDLESGVCLQVLEGHTDEIFSCAFNYEGDTLITGSKDNTCRIWRV